MESIETIFAKKTASDIITSLKERTTPAPNWAELVTEYDPTKHEIIEDQQGRSDKHHPDGKTDKAARLAIGLEKLLTQRMAEFTFAIPVKRVYHHEETDNQKEIEKVIEKIYSVAHIDAENKKRAVAYYASCEALTLWYTKKLDKEHNLYGFPTKYKLKCKTFSPMDGTKLYPLIDEFGEMTAMSFEYRRKVEKDWVTFFETYTATHRYKWKSVEGGEWEQISLDDRVIIGKIPAVYIYRPHPVWYGLTNLRKDIEYTLSRNSDVIAYNSAPILKVSGTIIGDEMKGETRRVYRVQEGGDVSYVAWSQSIAALEYHVKTLLNLYFMQAQIPDISFENMRGLGNIGYDARKMLFTDAHMKIGDESMAWVEFFEREGNVIKAFLKQMNTASPDRGFKEEDIDSVFIEHTITPYIQDDEMLTINKWSKAGGDIPLVSPLEAIKRANLSQDPEKSYNDIIAYNMMMAALKSPQQEQNGEEEDNQQGNAQV